MSQKIKNSMIFLGIGIILILVYVFLIKGDEEVPSLVTSSNTSPVAAEPGGGPINQEFLSILLNIQSIKLEDSILKDPAYISLIDSSIIITPDGNEGRPNPFAPIGSDVPISSSPASPATPASSTPTSTPGNPASTPTN